MARYEQLNQNTILSYIKTSHQKIYNEICESHESTTVKELSDGNLNRIFLIQGSKKSIIVKQALPFVRIVPTWPLGIDRIYFEHQSYCELQQYCPSNIPKIYGFDKTQATILMEYLTPHVVLRQGLCEKRVFEELSDALGLFLAKSLFQTSDLALNTKEKRKLSSYFSGNHELCNLTEEVIFTCPYVRKDPSFENKFSKGLDKVVEELQNNDQLKEAVSRLKEKFLTNSQALLHGDLHTGSIMATEDGDVRVIDSEFAFVGPMGFDIGLLLANLVLSYCGHYITSTAYANEYLLKQIETLWQKFHEYFLNEWDNSTKQGSLYPSSMFNKTSSRFKQIQRDYLNSIFQDAIAFAGCEIIRRTIGVAHVDDLESIQDNDTKLKSEFTAVFIGQRLILNGINGKFKDISQVSQFIQQTSLWVRNTQHYSLTEKTSCLASIVLVAKYPEIGKTKTRLAKCSEVGPEVALDFAQSCILDLIEKFSSSSFEDALKEGIDDLNGISVDTSQLLERKILFAPHDRKEEFESWLKRECPTIASLWKLEPFGNTNLSETSQLTHKLSQGLAKSLKDIQKKSGRTSSQHGAVVFIGMDTPQLTKQEAVQGICTALQNEVFLSPATDGGYVLLAVPMNCNATQLFDDTIIAWSSENTFATQVKAILATGKNIRVGESFTDIDEVEDLKLLADAPANKFNDIPRVKQCINNWKQQ